MRHFYLSPRSIKIESEKGYSRGKKKLSREGKQKRRARSLSRFAPPRDQRIERSERYGKNQGEMKSARTGESRHSGVAAGGLAQP
ncbi:hypothetical protein Q8A67_019539 [Cirrhinus molitorella]|uniref:Uncharacterized protein n=1 Tax=Cirrhinus molitorella TaxID=172907 RepID=A0AA88PA38_9TELE|nr:hypothetical protein Q8A67_019539 [Cirrhinus molitorella]